MAKSASLAAQTPGALSTDLKLPGSFSAPAEAVAGRQIAPYITFCHHQRADEFKKLQGRFGNITEGDMYLIANDMLVHLNPAKLGLFPAYRQFWVLTNPAGEITAASWKEMPRPYKECIEAVVLVYLPDQVLPANIQFRSTKCPAGKALSDALRDADGKHQDGSPPWADRSPAHKETLVCQYAWMRFFGDVGIAASRISKSTGLPYKPSTCDIKPTSIPEWRLLDAMLKHTDAQKMLDDAERRFQERVNEITAKVNSTNAANAATKPA